MVAFMLHLPENPLVKVDLLIYSGVDFNEAYDRKQVIKGNEGEIHVASIR